MPLNVITAKFYSGTTQVWTEEAWQWDYGQVLQFDGLTLPEAYEVHFSNTPMSGASITQIGNADGVTVPDQFFTGGETIYAWVFLHDGEDDGETVYMVTIPVKKRPQPSDDQPTPEEQSAITQAIAALNIAVEKSAEAITHYPKLDNGTWWVWDVTSEAWVDTGVVAQGEDGFSPSANVVKVGHTATITITDKSGTTTASISDGSGGGGGGGAVDSVNGKTGAVVLDAEDVGALPDNTSIPGKISDLQNDTYQSETWTFTLDDDTTVTKKVVIEP